MRIADVLVVGGGVFGLSAALACAREGLRVTVAEAGRIGQGASGGLLGALTPHRPSGAWHALKAVQLAGLLALPDHAATLAAETGRDPGYAPTGRLIPLMDMRARMAAEADAAAARRLWPEGSTLDLLDAPPPAFASHLAPDAFAAGTVRDTLSARLDPRAWLATLRTALTGHGADLREGWPVLRIETGRRVAAGPSGEIAAAHIVIATGHDPAALVPALGLGAFRPVAGQAAMLAAALPEKMPILHAAGIFIVRHAANRVAVGSTSEPGRDRPKDGTALGAALAQAATLCPALAGARVIERWSGVRPRPPGRYPMVGAVPGYPGLWVAGGGYRIGFAIAHLAGAALAAGIAGETTSLALPHDLAPAPGD